MMRKILNSIHIIGTCTSVCGYKMNVFYVHDSPFFSLENSQITPTTSGQGSSTRKRSLRYIQDIKTPDLETPRRRRECLSLIRYESKTVQGKMKTLKQQNVRLRKKLDNMKQLLFELQQKDMLTAQHVANLMVSNGCRYCRGNLSTMN